MFTLHESDLRRSILGCGDGPAAFNAELTRRGGRILSIDPIYSFSADEIQTRIAATFGAVLAETEKNRDLFVWRDVGDVGELGRRRMEAMRCFLTDYPGGRRQGRYRAGELPSLDLADNRFDLALCSHFLFLYSDHLSTGFHVRSVLELCRVAREVRIFPLLDLDGRPSPHLGVVTDRLRRQGHEISICTVAYEFQKGGNRMLRIRTAGNHEAQDR